MTRTLNMTDPAMMASRPSWGGDATGSTSDQPTESKLAALFQRLTTRPIPAKILLATTSQLATMLASGCDLCAGLDAMARQQPHPRMKMIVNDLHESVKSGKAFSQALARHPDVFSSLYVTMVKAGETAGLMRNMLSALQLMIRNQIRIGSSIRSALLYPCILSTVAFGAIAVMTTFVLPRFAAVFKASNAQLPLATSILLDSCGFVSAHVLLILLGLVLLVSSVLWLVHQPWVRTYTHIWVLRIPLLGPTMQLSYVVRSIQTLGMLIKSGLPLADALNLIRDMMPNIYYRQFFEELREHIAEGKQLSPDFERSTLFPPMISQMISVGEQTGTLANVCLEVASFHEEEMQERIKILTTAIEPIIIIVLGGVVGFIAVSVILPMFRISAAIGH